MTNALIVDSHLHLQDFGADIELSQVIQHARNAGVAYLVNNGTSETDWYAVLECARAHSEIVPCLGLHPWFVKNRSKNWLGKLENLVASNACCVGEIGLDKCVENYDACEQEEVFLAQLDLARRYNRPAMVHCVRLWGKLVDILRNESDLPHGFLLHAYGGSADLVRPLAEMGAYFSFSGTVLKESYKRAREALLAVPIDRLLVESDAPNMIPPPEFRAVTLVSEDGAELNSPGNLHAIVEGIADLLGKPAQELREILWQNATSFFEI